LAPHMHGGVLDVLSDEESKMLRKLVLMVAGAALVMLGIIGLVMPVMPGLLLLAAAAGCFSLASTRFRVRLERHLNRHPRYRRALHRWQTGTGLPPLRRLQLAFWLTLRSLVPERRA